VSLDSARRAVDARLLLTIAAALGVAEALNVSGAAEFIVLQMLNLTNVLTNLGLSLPMAALILLYVTAVVASELLTNTAAAALMFPFAMQFAGTLEVDYMPFVIAIMIASSAAFATPIGYQTNLMVYGPGGYKFGDFLRIGVPMDIIVGITAIAVIPFAFPFSG
jgi:di/tricarboxylate transporter